MKDSMGNQQNMNRKIAVGQVKARRGDRSIDGSRKRSFTGMQGRIFMAAFAMLMLPLLAPVKVYAGSINSAEQGVLYVISQRQEYDGAYYKVTDGYIAKVSEYLSRDGIDMSSEEAESYVAQFYANISVGIASGYMEKVGDVEVAGSDTGSDAGAGTGAAAGATGDAGNSTDAGGSAGDKSGTGTDAGTGATPGTGAAGGTGKDKGGSAGDNDSTNDEGSGAEEDGNGGLSTGTDNGNGNGGGTDAGSGNGTGSTGTGNGNGAGNAAGVAGMFTDPEGDGPIEDNTVGSTTDGAVEYVVLPIDEQTMYVQSIEALSVHEEAYKDSPVIGEVKVGEPVKVTGGASTGWAQIAFGEKTGYVSAAYLRTQGYMDKKEAEKKAAEEAEQKAQEEARKAEEAQKAEEEAQKAEEEKKAQEAAAAEEAAAQQTKDYSDAKPVENSINLGVIALVIAVVCAAALGGVLFYHKKKSRSGKR